MTPVICGRCGQLYSPEAWSALPWQRTIARDDLQGIVLVWPPGRVVEVRQCTRCGCDVARAMEK